MNLALLGAGFATRMYPLTRDQPKPLLEIHGQPLLTRLLWQAWATGALKQAAVVVNARFRIPFEHWAAQQSIPVQVVANEAQESAKAPGALADLQLLLASAFPSLLPASIPSLNEQPWMVLAGDNLLDFLLADAVAMQAEDLTTPLFLVREIEGQVPPGRYSEVTLDAQDRVTQIREKPSDPTSSFSAIGAYLLPPDLPSLLQRYLEQGGEPDAPGHLMAWLVQERGGRAWRIPAGSWWDIGNLETYHLAKKAQLKNQIAIEPENLG